MTSSSVSGVLAAFQVCFFQPDTARGHGLQGFQRECVRCVRFSTCAGVHAPRQVSDRRTIVFFTGVKNNPTHLTHLTQR